MDEQKRNQLEQDLEQAQARAVFDHCMQVIKEESEPAEKNHELKALLQAEELAGNFLIALLSIIAKKMAVFRARKKAEAKIMEDMTSEIDDISALERVIQLICSSQGRLHEYQEALAIALTEAEKAYQKEEERIDKQTTRRIAKSIGGRMSRLRSRFTKIFTPKK